MQFTEFLLNFANFVSTLCTEGILILWILWKCFTSANGALSETNTPVAFVVCNGVCVLSEMASLGSSLRDGRRHLVVRCQ